MCQKQKGITAMETHQFIFNPNERLAAPIFCRSGSLLLVPNWCTLIALFWIRVYFFFANSFVCCLLVRRLCYLLSFETLFRSKICIQNFFCFSGKYFFFYSFFFCVDIFIGANRWPYVEQRNFCLLFQISANWNRKEIFGFYQKLIDSETTKKPTATT